MTSRSPRPTRRPPADPRVCPLGVELIGIFEKELAKHEKSRQELAKAEKLFDLAITMYPQLLKVQKEMSGLRAIYDLYEGLKVGPPPTPGTRPHQREGGGRQARGLGAGTCLTVPWVRA